MTGDRRWSDEAVRYLDGEGPLPRDPAEREAAERFAVALRDYAEGLPDLEQGLDARIMEALRFRTRRRPRWRWLVEPRAFALRPALAAAAIIALVAGSSFITLLIERGSTRPASPPVAATPAGGTVLVRFELRAPDAHRVALAGSFNEWSDSSIVFTPAAEPGLWSVTVALRPGRYQYLFVVDGERWIPDPEAHAQVEDDFGQRNSLLVVGPRGVVRS